MFANKAQEEIISTIEGQMIVVACPGSGKTTTLLRRIHHMEEEGIDPSSILMITFTKAAAKEMGERYRKMYGKGGPTFCTIHALCLALLKTFACFSVENVAKHPSDYIFPVIQYNKDIRDKGKFMTDALTDISVVKNSKIDLTNYEPKCCNDPDLFRKVYRYYTRKMEEDGMIDYDDMLLNAYQLMQNERDVLDWIRDRYAYIHVDEYQDTNFLQRDIIYLIAGENGNLAVVGDDDQSIYAFRGARPEVMFDFKKKYPDAKEVYMVTNYRSDQRIIRSASMLIKQNTKRFPKDIVASSKEEGHVYLAAAPDRSEAYRWLASEIKTLITEKHIPAHDIAILYRVNAQSTKAAEALHAANVPFHSNETIESRYENWMFQDLASYFKVANGIGTKQDFLRTVTHPNRWMSGYDYAKYGLDPAKLHETMVRSAGEEWQKKKAAENANNYLSLMRFISTYDIGRSFDIILSAGRYMDYLEEYASYRNEDPGQYEELVEEYRADIEKWGIKTFAEWMRKAQSYNYIFRDAQKEKSGICLSTMHKAKGLEWGYVFLVDCVEGMVPYRKNGKVEDPEEERRLFYVAMTRAKHNLTLLTYREGQKKPAKPSRFLYEAGVLEGGWERGEQELSL